MFIAGWSTFVHDKSVLSCHLWQSTRTLSQRGTCAGSSHEYQKWVAVEGPRWRDATTFCPALAGRLPIDRLFELCPPTAPRFYSISSSLMATPDEVAITVGQLAYHLPDGRKRKVRACYVSSVRGCVAHEFC